MWVIEVIGEVTWVIRVMWCDVSDVSDVSREWWEWCEYCFGVSNVIWDRPSSNAFTSFLSRIQLLQETPSSPYLNLYLAISYLQHSIKRSAVNRNFHVALAFGFFHRYHELSQRNAESCYNLARAYHYLGINHLAIKFYQKVFSAKSMQSSFCSDFTRSLVQKEKIALTDAVTSRPQIPITSFISLSHQEGFWFFRSVTPLFFPSENRHTHTIRDGAPRWMKFLQASVMLGAPINYLTRPSRFLSTTPPTQHPHPHTCYPPPSWSYLMLHVSSLFLAATAKVTYFGP